ncbi:3-hydroxybutyrate dehydrogenase [Steroidobacter agaridevorans]|uniref:3-hydroxybutyrate dehydrogenase n=1 Tax=Steroidobacter agaridevorans TaxID=2695856 RepID=A0A829Y4T6_9GAMM|nr:3-hydroxybutyrate dehydrogenase [Steroidobacter agaridevorans]GFE78230.1 3-hydroxybutyrate dehydrogenase [Steroidobacter agaridevorans]
MASTHRILITGAASGIGLALTEHFSALGHEVIACDLQPGALDSLQKSLPRIRTLAFDLSDAKQIDAAFASLGDDTPDILINNAGLQFVSPLEEFPPEKWQLLIAVMLTGTALLTRAVLPSMRKRNYGRVVNIGSIHALIASPFKSAYVAAKHGLVGFSKAIALETSDADITINTVCPGYVKTPLVDAQIASLAKTHHMTEQQVIEEIMLKPMPKGEFITTEELVGCVEFLLSPSARNITGQCLVLDGGWTAQ